MNRLKNLQSSLVNADNPFEWFLRQFTFAHAEHVDAALGLELLTDEELLERESKARSDIIAPTPAYLGSAEGESFRVVAVVAGPFVSLGGSYAPAASYARRAWEDFQPLAALAGAFLPDQVIESLAHTRFDPEGLWYRCICEHKKLEIKELGPYPEFRRLLSSEVFLDSIEVIKKWKLADPQESNCSAGGNKKIKLSDSTVKVIRLLESGKKIDEITNETGKSASNIRKIKSHWKAGKYEL